MSRIPIADRIRYFALIAPILLSLSGCGDDGGGDDTMAPPQHFSRSAAAYFSVRSGSTIDPIGQAGIFDEGRDEAFLEFAIDFPESSPVVVEFEVLDFTFGPNDPAIDFKVAVYDANGAADASDYGRGTLLTTLTLQPGELEAYSLDVTSHVASLQAAGVTHVGIRFYESTFGQLAVQPGAMLEAGP